MKKLIDLCFSISLTGEPITYRLIKDYGLRINIIRATIDHNICGKLLIEIDGGKDELLKAIGYLEGIGVEVREYDSSICIDKSECVDCGGCTAVCEVDALIMNEDWELEFDGKKCLGCRLCIKACPTRAITTFL